MVKDRKVEGPSMTLFGGEEDLTGKRRVSNIQYPVSKCPISKYPIQAAFWILTEIGHQVRDWWQGATIPYVHLQVGTWYFLIPTE